MDQNACFSLQRFAAPGNSERIARLRQHTDDADILAHVDHVAFDQEDLIRLLQPISAAMDTIYLCGSRFAIPPVINKNYVGIGDPEVSMAGDHPPYHLYWGIHFTNCRYSERYLKVVEENASKDVPPMPNIPEIPSSYRNDYAAAVASGDAKSMLTLGQAHEHGFALQHANLTEGIKWYKAAMHFGNLEAANRLRIFGILSKNDLEHLKSRPMDNFDPLKELRSLGLISDEEMEHWKTHESHIKNLVEKLQHGSSSGSPEKEMERLLQDPCKKETLPEDERDAQYLAEYELAKAYYHGEGKEKDDVMALKLFRRSADRGNSEAMVMLGSMYCNGEGGDQDYEVGNYWYEKAVKAGNASAMCKLGMSYELGYGKKVDLDKAEGLFLQALDGGDEEAEFCLGHVYEAKGQYGKAIELFQRAAADGKKLQDSAEGFIAGIYRFHLKDSQKAIEWYERSAGHGRTESMCSLGIMYLHGECGLEKDPSKAKQWILKAAGKGDAGAMVLMGSYHEQGEMVEQDDKAAMAWYQLASKFGDGTAMYKIGNLYFHGCGVEEDLECAEKWYHKALDAGHWPALVQLGVVKYLSYEYDAALKYFQMALKVECDDKDLAALGIARLYEGGYGVEKDSKEAFRWYQVSAEYGLASAMVTVGDMLLKGEGVRRDVAKARKWYKRALEAGDEEAQARLNAL